MAHEAPGGPGQRELTLPEQVCGLVEVRRLQREVGALDEFMRQHHIREPGKQPSVPRVSQLLDKLTTLNGLQLLRDQDRQHLAEFLAGLEQSAPRLHMSFATEATPVFTAKLVGWLRANIDARVLLEVGLQPAIAAGCIVRTPNRVFDFSLRRRLDGAQDLLVQSLEAAAGPETAPAPPVTALEEPAP